MDLSIASPTGKQFIIHAGAYSATICEVGATLRSLTCDGVELVDGFGPDEFSLSGRGQVLAPWPGRLDHGAFSFGGHQAQAAINDIEHDAAIHGLVRWRSFELISHDNDAVVLGMRIFPSPSYPFSLLLTLEYRVGPEGLVVSAEARNVGTEACPFALGFHTYLTLGDLIDTATLTFPGTISLSVNDRLIPTGENVPVKGTPCDFTSGGSIGAVVLDTTFSNLNRSSDGTAVTILGDTTMKRTVELWVDEQFGYLQLFTGDTIGDVGRRRRGLAVEPMTAPPNTLQSGEALIVLAPDQEWRGQFGIRSGK